MRAERGERKKLIVYVWKDERVAYSSSLDFVDIIIFQGLIAAGAGGPAAGARIIDFKNAVLTCLVFDDPCMAEYKNETTKQ